ncbi:MAG: hypothetical protein ACJ8CR_06080 [Roseiflexaceae bacterium]
MEGSSRTRSILGIGLVLIGSLLLLRAISGPIVPGPLVGHNIEYVARIEAQRAQIEAQAEAQQAQLEARQAQIEAQAEARQAQIEAQAEQQGDSGALPALPPVPPMPPMPPIWHIGGWLKPTIVLLVLLVLLLRRRGRGERAPAQA